MIFLLTFTNGIIEVIIADSFEQAMDYAKTITDNPKLREVAFHDISSDYTTHDIQE